MNDFDQNSLVSIYFLAIIHGTCIQSTARAQGEKTSIGARIDVQQTRARVPKKVKRETCCVYTC